MKIFESFVGDRKVVKLPEETLGNSRWGANKMIRDCCDFVLRLKKTSRPSICLKNAEDLLVCLETASKTCMS